MNKNLKNKKGHYKDRQYNTRLQKGGALLDDMRTLVRNWCDSGENSQTESAVVTNILGKKTRVRASDLFRRSFLPRFVHGTPADAWKIVRRLEDHNLPLEILKPVYYWITARNERILYDFVSTELLYLSKSHVNFITSNDASDWIKTQISECNITWTDTVTIKVARGMLAALRDFGILDGYVKKTIAPIYVPIESFAYIAFALHQEDKTGASLIKHPDWNLFLFTSSTIEHMFLEADRHGLLKYQAAGNIVRIEFPRTNYKEMADVVAAKAH